MYMKGLPSVIYLESFRVFPEYFIGVSSIYVLIVVVLITYNVYGLMLQKAISECLALVMLMSCYLLLNDDLFNFPFALSFHNSIINDYLAFFSKLLVSFSSALFFFIIANFLKQHRLTSFEYLLVLLFAILGLVLLCGSNDLLTAYLAIELTSLASYLLASFKKTSSYSAESGLKYFVTGALSSAFFLLGSSFIYGTTGSINFKDFNFMTETCSLFIPVFTYFYVCGVADDPSCPSMAIAMLSLIQMVQGGIPLNLWYNPLTELGLAFIILSLFIKLGLAPFHLWSLDVYEGSPTISTFFFAVICKLSVFVLLIRLCYKGFINFKDTWVFYSIAVAILSIFVGSFGGLKTRKLKTLLAYSSISNMGYTLLAFSSFNKQLGFETVFFYLIIYVITGLAIWFIILSLKLKNKTVTQKYSLELGDIVLLHSSNKSLAIAFALTIFSISGLPPMIGFLAKMSVFLTVVYNKFYAVALFTILCSVISTFYYVRVIKILYFENIIVGKLYYSINNQKILILSLLVFLLLFLFVNPTFLYLILIKMSESSFFLLNIMK